MRTASLPFLVALCVELSISQPNYWQATNAPTALKVWSIAAKGNGYILAASEDSGVCRSTDLGQSWTRVNNGLTYPDVLALSISDKGDLFAGTVGVFRSTDDGQNWTPTDTLNAAVFCFAFKPNNTLLVGTGGGVYRSTDFGGTWVYTSNGLPRPSSIDIRALAANVGNVFAATGDSGVFRTTDNGDNWSAANNGISNAIVRALVVTPLGDLLAGTASGGAWRSTDKGNTWNQLSLAAYSVSSFAVNSRGHIFAGTNDAGVFSSTDGGASWAQVSSGLTNTNIRALAIDSNGYMFAGTDMGGIFRSVESTVSVKEAVSAYAHSAMLLQNYPNPFNPTTAISYQLSAVSEVKLVVYDLLGREVAVMVNERKAPGTYEVNFDGSDLASGVYFYRLQAGDFIQSKKFVLLK